MNLFRMKSKSTQGPLQATSNTPSRKGLAATAEMPLGSLTESVERIMVDKSRYTAIQQDQVPACIASSPIWARLRPFVKEIYTLCDLSLSDKTVAVLLVVLKGLRLKLVVKGVPAARAKDSQELQSELNAADLFAGNPLMATSQAACFDSEGNFCTIMPYAGCSLGSLLEHPDWFEKTSVQERLDFSKTVMLHNLMAYKSMQKAGVGYYYRDVKPDNCCICPETGRATVIDFGLMIRSTKEDYFFGETLGYHAPELVAGADKGLRMTQAERKAAVNPTTDVFLTSFVGLQAAVGLQDLPWKLHCDPTTGLNELLGQHAAAAAAGYEDLIARVPCPVARDFFLKTMCADPAQRLTPAQALKHEWLNSSKPAVQRTLASLTPAYKQQNQQLAEIFAGVQAVIVPKSQQHQQPLLRKLSAAFSRKSISLDIPHTPRTGSSCNFTSRLSASSTLRTSSCLDGDTSATDQLPAASGTAATCAAKKEASLLQRGKKLLSKLSRRSSKSDSSLQESSVGQDGSDGVEIKVKSVKNTAAAAVVIDVQGWMDEEEPCAVRVTGMCGFRWFCIRQKSA